MTSSYPCRLLLPLVLSKNKRICDWTLPVFSFVACWHVTSSYDPAHSFLPGLTVVLCLVVVNMDNVDHALLPTWWWSLTEHTTDAIYITLPVYLHLCCTHHATWRFCWWSVDAYGGSRCDLVCFIPIFTVFLFASYSFLMFVIWPVPMHKLNC